MKALQAKYATQPEFWQLAYWNTLQELPDYNVVFEEGDYAGVHLKATAQLQKARELGLADSATLALLYLELKRDYPHSEAAEVKVAHEAEADKVWQEWVNSDRQSAWPYYVKVQQHIALNEYPQAYAALLAGDLASNKQSTGCFPLTEVSDRLALNAYAVVQENPVLTGVLLSGELPEDLVDFMWHHEDGGKFAMWLRESNRLDGLNAYYRMGCHMGRKRYGYWWQLMTADRIVRQAVYNFLASDSNNLSGEERWVLLQVVDRNSRLVSDNATWTSLVYDRFHYLESWNIVGSVTVWVPIEPEQIQPGLPALFRHVWLCNTPDGARLRTSLKSTEVANLKHAWFEYRQLSLIDLQHPVLPEDWWDLSATEVGMSRFPAPYDPEKYPRYQDDSSL